MICLTDTEIITERDLYFYHRGMMQEHLLHRGKVDPEAAIMLHEWIKAGNTVHNNPWDIRKCVNGNHGVLCDYLDALAIRRMTSK